MSVRDSLRKFSASADAEVTESDDALRNLRKYVWALQQTAIAESGNERCAGALWLGDVLKEIDDRAALAARPSQPARDGSALDVQRLARAIALEIHVDERHGFPPGFTAAQLAENIAAQYGAEIRQAELDVERLARALRNTTAGESMATTEAWAKAIAAAYQESEPTT